MRVPLVVQSVILSEPLSGQKVIAAKDVETVTDAVSVLDESRFFSEALLQDAAINADMEQQLARTFGLQQGRSLQSEGQFQTANLPRTFAPIEFSDVFIDAVVESLRRLLTSDYEICASRIKSLIHESPARQWARVRMSKSLLARTEPLIIEMMNDSKLRLEFVADSNLSLGDVVVETESGVIDGQIEVLLESVRSLIGQVVVFER